MKSRVKQRLLVLLLALLGGVASPPLQGSPLPKRVVVIVLDQMRPDYIDTYNLPHLKQLREEAVEFVNGNVGQFSTATDLSHPTIGSGLFPKHYGWSDQIFPDETSLLGAPDLWYKVTDLSLEEIQKILRANLPQPTALRLIKEKLKGKIIAVGQKRQATTALGGIDADRIITLKKMKEGPWKGWCLPDGLAVPPYISQPEGGRFYLDCHTVHPTQGDLPPFEGNQYLPGNDPQHLGGDIWVADVGLAAIEQEKDWRVLLLTMAGIDKMGHASGEMDQPRIQKRIREAPYNLEKILKIADAQVGRLVERLKQSGLWEETLFVVTADHGGLSNAKHLYGHRDPELKNFSALYGKFAKGDKFRPSKKAARWLTPEVVDHAFLDTAVRIWLTEPARQEPASHCKSFSKMPGAVAVYVKESAEGSWSYRICTQYRGPKLPDFLDPSTLLNTMAAKNSADLVIQLADDSGYAEIGSHGGLQEKALRIPMLIHSPAMKAGRSECPFRLVDLIPVLLTNLGIPLPTWLDGDARCF